MTFHAQSLAESAEKWHVMFVICHFNQWASETPGHYMQGRGVGIAHLHFLCPEDCRAVRPVIKRLFPAQRHMGLIWLPKCRSALQTLHE